MDQRTRAEDLTELMETWADNVLSRVRIAVPVQLTKDSDGHTVTMQPQVQGIAAQPDGTMKFMDLPAFENIPISNPAGGGTTLTFPHKQKDEGIALFTMQSFSRWFKDGGIQPPDDIRMHSLADCFYIPGARNSTRKLENVSTTSAQLRSDDGKHMVDMHPQNGPTLSADGGKHVVSVNPKSGVSIKTAMKLAVEATQGMALMGDLAVKGNVGASGTIGAPIINGQTGGIFTGMLGGALGTLLVLGALNLLPAAGGSSASPQEASYARAVLVR